MQSVLEFRNNTGTVKGRLITGSNTYPLPLLLCRVFFYFFFLNWWGDCVFLYQGRKTEISSHSCPPGCNGMWWNLLLKQRLCLGVGTWSRHVRGGGWHRQMGDFWWKHTKKKLEVQRRADTSVEREVLVVCVVCAWMCLCACVDGIFWAGNSGWYSDEMSGGWRFN